MNLNPETKAAYKLLHDSTLALAKVERNGIRIDMQKLQASKDKALEDIAKLKDDFMQSKFFKEWQKSTAEAVNPNSLPQLGKFLYEVKGIKPTSFTKGGKDGASKKGSMNADAIEKLNMPELEYYVQKNRYKKIIDVLSGFERETVNGFMHPGFALNNVSTYRSCVAKGTKILVARNFESHPNGIPIEDVKKGDYVYCFDDKLQPALKKVLWSGKTGHREVIRLHYSVNGRGTGYLDVTPEHKIRLIDGAYVQAKDCVGDFRDNTTSKHCGKIRTLSCARKYDKLNFTGHLTYGKGIYEYHLIYNTFFGDIANGEVIHHKDGNHLNHTPSNLEKMTLEDHSRHHGLNVSDELRQFRIDTLNENRHKIKPLFGADNPLYLGLTKYQCLRMLAKKAGKISIVEGDFDTFKKYLAMFSIDYKNVRLRYDIKDKYIWKSELLRLTSLGRPVVSKKLGHNYYKLLDLYKIYGISTERKWGNQFGEFKPGNHVITKVEWIKKVVDVYDLEVEDYHNFIANEICVHNSSSAPNFQNIPIRDDLVAKFCRGVIYPRKGNLLLESDFKSVEVGISACVNKDPMLLKYMRDKTTDMHRDVAQQIFFLTKFDSHIKAHSNLRKATKNSFVFPEFYGSYYKNCAKNFMSKKWCNLPEGTWKPGKGMNMVADFGEEPLTKFHLSDHMRKNGIKSFDDFVDHLEKIEYDFWNVRFAGYFKWKADIYADYCKKGYVDLYTGFRCWGPMRQEQVNNFPIQGASFHCLLKCLIEINRIATKEKWKTKMIGQIHDSMIFDVYPPELEHVASTVNYVTSEWLPKQFPWIIVPISVEMEKTEIDCPWSEKHEYEFKA